MAPTIGINRMGPALTAKNFMGHGLYVRANILVLILAEGIGFIYPIHQFYLWVDQHRK